MLLGLDAGSSAIKASFLSTQGKLAGAAFSPQRELTIQCPQVGFAEQDPQVWWKNLVNAVKEAKRTANLSPDAVKAIGISYQMHGLVLVDKDGEVLRPAIIWCDSRAVDIGADAFQKLGSDYCLQHLLNSPGNFTASKLAWVAQNEPKIFERIHKVMLPGDYLAYRLTGEMHTTIPGLSEGMLWDFKQRALAEKVLLHYGASASLIPNLADTFSNQGLLSKAAAAELGLKAGTPITYRAGDQPNNAFSLNVLNPGEIAATAGTSGVVYGVSDQQKHDPLSRVNTFAHVNYTPEDPRYGVLLCINGTGCLNSWLKKLLGKDVTYPLMDQNAQESPIGSNGLVFLPFGNGAERVLGNRTVDSSLHGLNFVRHSAKDMCRAAQEGIVFALKYGMDVMNTVAVEPRLVRAGKANMFLSPLFREAFVNTTGATLQLFETDGAQGAARGAGLGAGIFGTERDAFVGLNQIDELKPDPVLQQQYGVAYQKWLKALERECVG